MKILMLAQFYPPILGGEERLTHDLSVGLVKRGHEVSVVTLMQPGLEPYEIQSGVHVYRVKGFTQNIKWLYSDTARRLATPYPDPGVVRNLWSIIRDTQPDVIHGQNWMFYSVFPLVKQTHAALVLTLNDHSMACAKKKMIYLDGTLCHSPGWGRCLKCASDHYGTAKGIPTTLGNFLMARFNRNLVDMFIPVSQSVADLNQLDKYGLPYEIIDNFVSDDMDEQPEIESHYRAQIPDSDFLLFVGAFGHYKGVDVLLEAYRKLDSPPPLVLLGYDTTEYPVQTSDLPANVKILKNVPHHVVMEFWRHATIGLVPSTWAEPFGIVAIEALATGTPVIASRIGGLQDIVKHQETGLLVEPDNVDALYQAMHHLLANPPLREEMGRKAREQMTRFQESTVVPKYEQIYEKLVSAKAGT